MINLCGKGNVTKLLYVSILVFAFTLNPALLRAETSAKKADDSVKSLTIIALQVAPDVHPERAENPLPASVSATKAAQIIIALEEEKTDGNEPSTATEKSDVESESVSEADQGESLQIADPLAPVNKAVFYFNDKLYFWGIKPVTQVYSHVVPEDFRFALSNVYDNLWAPSRVLNNLFQLRLKAAGNELIRFVFNSFAGIGGMGDMANEALGIKKQEADFGQTLGHYGIGHGIYLVLPVFGPSSVRDGVGLVADQLMHPLTYVKSSNLTFGQKLGIFAHSKINDTSFKIGDYEAFKESALDPYISMKDAYLQYRQRMVEESKK